MKILRYGIRLRELATGIIINFSPSINNFFTRIRNSIIDFGIALFNVNEQYILPFDVKFRKFPSSFNSLLHKIFHIKKKKKDQLRNRLQYRSIKILLLA